MKTQVCVPVLKQFVFASIIPLLGFSQSTKAAGLSNESLPETCYLFSYFLDNGQDGLHLAWSRDGYRWEPLKGGASFLTPQVGKEKLMRDPCITRGPDGTFHMVWTDSWTDRTIGYASSKDLVHWSDQRALPVMEHEPTARNCWAPEINWDAKQGHFLIYWSTTIPGRFPATAKTAEDDYNHRIYATTTRDFASFTPTKLFFDPGFNCIDASIVPSGGKFAMFFKDETKFPSAMKNLRIAFADEIGGPYTVDPQPLNPPDSWTEGPTSLQTGGETIVYFDCYRKHHYGALVTRDFKSWIDITSKLDLPKGTRHGTAFPVSRAIVQQLIGEEAKSSSDPLSWTNPILPQRADPHVILHNDGYYYFTATVPEYDRIEIRRARTLGELPAGETKVIWKKHDRGPMSHHVWAPEIHFIDGKWYIYFAAGKAEAIWDIRMYVLENSSPNPLEGEWTEKGQIKMNWESFTLDATTFEHSGSRYLAWAQSAPQTKGTNIYIAKMDSPWSITGTQVLLTKPEFSWETIGHHVNEAPSVIHKNGRLFMTYSASATDANYCLGLLVAKEDSDLLDPKSWSKSPSPVLKSDTRASQFGPGHNAFTTTPDGKTDILVYHSRNYEKIQGEPLHNPDRATRAQVIQWKANGLPDFGNPVLDGPSR
jgi:GH43 family beta-xylosidase